MKRWKVRALGAPVALAMLAAACGGDDGGGSATENTIDRSVNEALKQQAGDGGPTVDRPDRAQPTSMEEWEEIWEEERAAIVEKIKDEGWGKSADGTTLTGPSGFTIDLAQCGTDWSDTEGLTDTSIKIGQTIAQSGTLADYGNYGKSIDALFDHYNKQGFFKDSTGKTRTVNYIQKDDGYDPARTIPLVDELLDSERVFAIWTLGTPSTMKTYQRINERCVPHPYAMTGHPAWGDPENHPWTTGAPVPAYTTETQFWGNFIEERLDEFGDKIVVAALVMNNDFGKVYDAGFRAYLAQSDLLRDRVEFVTETIEPAAPAIKDPMTTLASKQPDIFIAMTAGTSCTQAVTEAAENGMKEEVDYLFQPLTCTGVSFVSKDKVGGDGSASDGWWIFNPGVKDIKDPAYANDPWIKFVKGLLEARNVDPNVSSSLGAGFAYGWPLVQALRIAGELDGGLTRSNLILAQRALDMTPPTHLWGLRARMDGNADSYLIEGGVFAIFDSASQTWKDQGEIFDLEGKSQNCAWDQSTSTCR